MKVGVLLFLTSFATIGAHSISDSVLNTRALSLTTSNPTGFAFDRKQNQIFVSSLQGDIEVFNTTVNSKTVGVIQRKQSDFNQHCTAISFHEQSSTLWCVEKPEHEPGAKLVSYVRTTLDWNSANISQSCSLPFSFYTDLVITPTGIVFAVDNLGKVVKFNSKSGRKPKMVVDDLESIGKRSMVFHKSGLLLILNHRTQELTRVDVVTKSRTPLKLFLPYSTSVRDTVSPMGMTFLSDGRLVLLSAPYVHLLQEVVRGRFSPSSSSSSSPSSSSPSSQKREVFRSIRSSSSDSSLPSQKWNLLPACAPSSSPSSSSSQKRKMGHWLSVRLIRSSVVLRHSSSDTVLLPFQSLHNGQQVHVLRAYENQTDSVCFRLNISTVQLDSSSVSSKSSTKEASSLNSDCNADTVINTWAIDYKSTPEGFAFNRQRKHLIVNYHNHGIFAFDVEKSLQPVSILNPFSQVSNHRISTMGIDEKRDLLWCIERINFGAGCVLIAFDYEMLMTERAKFSNMWGIEWNHPLHWSASEATKHRIDLPHGIYVDLVVSPKGVVFIVDATGEVIKFDPRTDGAQPELVSEGDDFYNVPSIVYHDSGVLIVTNSVQQTLHRIDPTTGERTTISVQLKATESGRFDQRLSVLFLRDGRLLAISSPNIYVLQEEPSPEGQRWAKARVLRSFPVVGSWNNGNSPSVAVLSHNENEEDEIYLLYTRFWTPFRSLRIDTIRIHK